MPRRCCVCDSKQASRGKKAECSFHRFPKDQTIRAKWLKFCKFADTDAVMKLVLCSKHFTPEDFINYGPHHLSNLKLIPGAVPSIVFSHNKRTRNPQIANPSDNAENEAIPSLNDSRSCKRTCSPQADREIPMCEENPSDNAENEAIPSLNDSRSCKRTCSLQANREVPMCEENPSDNALNEPSTPKRRKCAEPRFIGDIRTPDVATPRRAKRTLKIAIDAVQRKSKQIRALQEQKRYMQKKLKALKDLIKHLQEKNLISEETANFITDGLSESVKQMLLRKKRHTRKYLPDLRSFAITLQFYSPKAYNYIRRIWGHVLPHPATLRGWYKVVNGSPGFTNQAFEAIARKQEVVCNIVMDEMSIREQLLYSNGKFYGGVNLGTGLTQCSNNVDLAKNALVFMAVALNGSWKVPLGYFLIKGLAATERANLLTKALTLMHEASARVLSITFDGAAVNLSMCTHLGTNENVYIFWDMCHMIKLVRNTWGDKGYLFDGNNSKIAWKFIRDLETLQNDEGLSAGTKLTKSHVNFNDNRMKVKLAVHTLSESVANALEFVHDIYPDMFRDYRGTAQFCLNFNNAFDILNCKNKFSKNRYCIPLNDENYEKLFQESQRLISYIESLKDKTRIPIIQTSKKTGFLGIIICLTNLFSLFNDGKKYGLQYLLSFKLSQDFLETFFSAIRGRGGWNNNPNALQFQAAYKRLLLRHDLKDFNNGNCLADNLEILSVSSKNKRDTGPVEEETNVSAFDHEFDHDYLHILWDLTRYVEDVVKYIAWFVVSKVLKRTVCTICKNHLTTTESPLLIKIKNRGPLLNPSNEVIRICLTAEKVFREHGSVIFNNTNFKNILINKIMQRLGVTFNSVEMQEHALCQDILDNHNIELVKAILHCYLTVRVHHETRSISRKDST